MSRNPDTVISSESPQNRVRDGLLVSKTETLTDEPNTVSHISIQDSIHKTRVSVDKIEVVVMEKCLGENAAETDLLESKAQTLTMEGPSCDGSGDIDVRDSVGEVRVSGDEFGVVKEDVEKVSDVNVISGDENEGDKVAVGAEYLAVRDAVNEVRVSGDEVGIVMEDVEKGLDVNGEGKEGDKAVVGSDLLDSKTGTLTVDLSSEHDAGGGVSGDEPATVLDNVLDEKVFNNEVKEGGKAVVGDDLLDSKTETLTDEPNTVSHISIQDSIHKTRVSGDKIEVVVMEKGLGENAAETHLLESKAQTLTMEGPSSGDIDVRDSVGEVWVSGDELGVVKEDVNVISGDENEGDKVAVGAAAEYLAVRDAVNEVRVSGDEVGIVMGDVEKGLDVNGGGKEGDKAVVGSDLLDSKTETLTVDLSSEHDAGGGVSGDEPATVFDNVLDEKVVNNEVKEGGKAVVGDDLLDSKTETLTMEPASDLDKGGDTVVQDSVGNASVSADEREIAMEKAGNVLDGKVVNNEGNKGDKTVDRADLLDLKTETRMMEASTDHDGGGDVGMQNSVDVSGDEREVVMENVEKDLHENVVEEEEKDGEYKVADMVWAKVRNYPWWPGQIFDPSASTDKAKKYSNKKAFFVAYFGDQSFAWNKASNIKPFRKNFSKMEKQSNSKGFCHAVNCALDEASRRVDFGLACSCLSKEVYDKIKTQVFVNAGIKSEASRIDGGDRFSTVATFKPENIVRSVQDLAREHFDGYSRLEVMSVRTQLLAYYRWKGYKIADYYEHLLWEEDKVVEDAKPASVGEKVSSKEWKLKACDSVPSKEEKDYTNMTRKGSSRDKVAENAKMDSASEKVSSKKRKLEACDSVPSKKEKRITDIDPKGSLSLSNGNNKMKKIGAKKAIVEDDSESPLVEEDKLVEDAKLASVGEKVYSKRRKSKASDLVTSKQEKNMTEMTQKGSLSLSNGKDKVKKIGAGKLTLEDDSELPSVEEDKVVEDARKENASICEKVYSKKRKSKASDSVPSKKGKRLTNMTAKGGSSVSNGKSKRKENGGNIITTEGNGVKEESQNGIGDKKSLISSPKKSFRIGESIMRIAKQLSESPSILKKESQESWHGMKKNSQKREKNYKSDEQTENSPALQKVPKTDRKQKKKDRKSVEAIQLEE